MSRLRSLRLVRLTACAVLSLCGGWTVCAGGQDAAWAVRCLVQSGQLNFGRLNLQHTSPVTGEGEAVVACQNTSSDPQRVTLSLQFPSWQGQTARLQSGRSRLPVTFYRDAQFALRWGDDLQGADGLTVPLDMGPGESRVLRLPVYALLHTPRGVAAGVYLSLVPLKLMTRPRPL
jgi:hypothetical protein